MATYEKYNPEEAATLFAADVDVFLRGYKWKSFVRVQPESWPSPGTREENYQVGWRVLNSYDWKQPGILQVLAARRASGLLLDCVVRPKLRLKHEDRHLGTSMKTVVDEVSQRICPSYIKSDWLLGNDHEKTPEPIKNMMARLQKVRNWLFFQENTWQNQCFTFTHDELETKRIMSMGSARRDLFLQEMEAAIMEIVEPGSGILTKFILQLLLGESSARAELRSQDTWTSPMSFAPFLKSFLPQFKALQISDLRLRNIALHDNKAFSNLLKWCVNLHTLECCIENDLQLAELGNHGEQFLKLTLKGVPQHLGVESFSKAFFDLKMVDFLSISNLETSRNGCNKFPDLEDMHLINAIVEDQELFLLRLAQLCPNLKRVRSNFKPLSVKNLLVKQGCNITDLYFEGKSPIQFYSQGLYKYFPELKALTLHNVDYLDVAASCDFTLNNITELNLTMKELTEGESDWMQEILPCLLQLKTSLLSLSIRSLKILHPETLVKIFIDFKQLTNFSVEYRGSISNCVPVMPKTNLRSFGLKCLENNSDATEAQILASVLTNSPHLTSIDVEITLDTLVLVLESIKNENSLPRLRNLKLNLSGDAEVIAREIEKLVMEITSIAEIRVINNKKLATELIKTLRNTDIKVSLFIDTGEI